MLYKKILLTSILSLNFLFADKFEIIKELEETAFKKGAEMDLSSVQKNIKIQNFDESISNIYSNAMKNVEIETKRLQGENVFLENMKQEEKKLTQKELDFKKFIVNNRIYIFLCL